MAPREEITLAPFKNGAFKLSASRGVTIIPAAFHDCKRLLPYDNFRGRPGLLRVDVLPFLQPQEDSQEEIDRLRETCYQNILSSLKQKEK
jgi:1-acyl-sn-glycerol-3-phosphate acyltransferase